MTPQDEREPQCRLCRGKGYTEEHQPGHTHYETDAGEPCPAWHYKRIPCICAERDQLRKERDALQAKNDELTYRLRAWQDIDGERAEKLAAEASGLQEAAQAASDALEELSARSNSAACTFAARKQG